MMRPCIHPLLALAVLAACADDPAAPATGGELRMTITAAVEGVAVCGAEVPLTVTVLNDRGRPVTDFLLNFNVLEGGGSMFGGAALTNNKGVASDIWILGQTPYLQNTVAVRTVDPVTGVGTTHATQALKTFSRIAFVRYDQVQGRQGIHTVLADGTSEMTLTAPPGTEWYDDYDPAWSPDGGKIAFTRRFDPLAQIFTVNPDGSELQAITPGGENNTEYGSYFPSWSPDGSRIVFAGVRPNANDPLNPFIGLFVMNRDGSGTTLLPGSEWWDYAPVWSPDGRSIAFNGAFLSADERQGIFVMNVDGSNRRRLTSSPDLDDSRPSWSPDSRKLVFSRLFGNQTQDIFVINADGTNLTRLTTSGEYFDPSWSPDGSKIVFASYNTRGLFTMNPDGTGIAPLTTGAFDIQPTWARGCVR